MYIYNVYIHITYLYVNLLSPITLYIIHTYVSYILPLSHRFLCTWRRAAQTLVQIFFHFQICCFFVCFDPLHFLSYHNNSITCRKIWSFHISDRLQKPNEFHFCTECLLNFFVFFYSSLNNNNYTYTLTVKQHALPRLIRFFTISVFFSFLFLWNGNSHP